MNRRLIFTVGLISILSYGLSSSPRLVVSPIREAALELQDQINEKRNRLKEIQKSADKYKEEIRKRELEQVSLENSIGLLENRMAAMELDISALQMEMEATLAEISLLDKDIIKRSEEFEKQKLLVASLIRQIHEADQTSYLEILLTNNTFSEFFERVERIQNVERRTYAAVQDLKQVREELLLRKQRADTKRVALDTQKAGLLKLREKLREEQQSKSVLIQEVAMSEQKFQVLLYETRQDEMAAESQVRRLEGSLRDILDRNDDMPGAGTILSWPVSSRLVTALYHDPTYPFRKMFEHSGIDVATAQGTPVKAAAPAYVASVKVGKLYGNYIMLIHSGGVATLYAHLSKTSVKADTYVERGEIIGYSGGTPGTVGSGLSTGPHLHFEVRTSGVPTNPLKYLVDVETGN